MFRELFYLQKSDRKVILALLSVIVVALGIIFFTGGENDETNALVSADSIDVFSSQKHHGDSSRRYPYREKNTGVKTVYVRTKVIYRDTAFQRGHRSRRSAEESTSC